MKDFEKRGCLLHFTINSLKVRSEGKLTFEERDRTFTAVMAT